jgi:hypothetical protein
VGVRCLHQIKKPFLSCLWKHPAMARFHGNPELGVKILAFFPLLNANVASIAIDEMRPSSPWSL